MLWAFLEGDESNRFFKEHNFTTVVHSEPHEKAVCELEIQEIAHGL
jgi:hypothetical protein